MKLWQSARIRRALVVGVAASMLVTVPAYADPQVTSNNCMGEESSSYSPEGTQKGAWAAYTVPLARAGQNDDVVRALSEGYANCGNNR